MINSLFKFKGISGALIVSVFLWLWVSSISAEQSNTNCIEKCKTFATDSKPLLSQCASCPNVPCFYPRGKVIDDNCLCIDGVSEPIWLPSVEECGLPPPPLAPKSFQYAQEIEGMLRKGALETKKENENLESRSSEQKQAAVVPPSTSTKTKALEKASSKQTSTSNRSDPESRTTNRPRTGTPNQAQNQEQGGGGSGGGRSGMCWACDGPDRCRTDPCPASSITAQSYTNCHCEGETLVFDACETQFREYDYQDGLRLVRSDDHYPANGRLCDICSTPNKANRNEWYPGVLYRIFEPGWWVPPDIPPERYLKIIAEGYPSQGQPTPSSCEDLYSSPPLEYSNAGNTWGTMIEGLQSPCDMEIWSGIACTGMSGEMQPGSFSCTCSARLTEPVCCNEVSGMPWAECVPWGVYLPTSVTHSPLCCKDNDGDGAGYGGTSIILPNGQVSTSGSEEACGLDCDDQDPVVQSSCEAAPERGGSEFCGNFKYGGLDARLSGNNLYKIRDEDFGENVNKFTADLSLLPIRAGVVNLEHEQCGMPELPGIFNTIAGNFSVASVSFSKLQPSNDSRFSLPIPLVYPKVTNFQSGSYPLDRAELILGARTLPLETSTYLPTNRPELRMVPDGFGDTQWILDMHERTLPELTNPTLGITYQLEFHLAEPPCDPELYLRLGCRCPLSDDNPFQAPNAAWTSWGDVEANDRKHAADFSIRDFQDLEPRCTLLPGVYLPRQAFFSVPGPGGKEAFSARFTWAENRHLLRPQIERVDLQRGASTAETVTFHYQNENAEPHEPLMLSRVTTSGDSNYNFYARRYDMPERQFTLNNFNQKQLLLREWSLGQVDGNEGRRYTYADFGDTWIKSINTVNDLNRSADDPLIAYEWQPALQETNLYRYDMVTYSDGTSSELGFSSNYASQPLGNTQLSIYSTNEPDTFLTLSSGFLTKIEIVGCSTPLAQRTLALHGGILQVERERIALDCANGVIDDITYTFCPNNSTDLSCPPGMKECTRVNGVEVGCIDEYQRVNDPNANASLMRQTYVEKSVSDGNNRSVTCNWSSQSGQLQNCNTPFGPVTVERVNQSITRYTDALGGFTEFKEDGLGRPETIITNNHSATQPAEYNIEYLSDGGRVDMITAGARNARDADLVLDFNYTGIYTTSVGTAASGYSSFESIDFDALGRPSEFSTELTLPGGSVLERTRIEYNADDQITQVLKKPFDKPNEEIAISVEYIDLLPTRIWNGVPGAQPNPIELQYFSSGADKGYPQTVRRAEELLTFLSHGISGPAHSVTTSEIPHLNSHITETCFNRSTWDSNAKIIQESGCQGGRSIRSEFNFSDLQLSDIDLNVQETNSDGNSESITFDNAYEFTYWPDGSLRQKKDHLGNRKFTVGQDQLERLTEVKTLNLESEAQLSSLRPIYSNSHVIGVQTEAVGQFPNEMRWQVDRYGRMTNLDPDLNFSGDEVSIRHLSDGSILMSDARESLTVGAPRIGVGGSLAQTVTRRDAAVSGAPQFTDTISTFTNSDKVTVNHAQSNCTVTESVNPAARLSTQPTWIARSRRQCGTEPEELTEYRRTAQGESGMRIERWGGSTFEGALELSGSGHVSKLETFDRARNILPVAQQGIGTIGTSTVAGGAQWLSTQHSTLTCTPPAGPGAPQTACGMVSTHTQPGEVSRSFTSFDGAVAISTSTYKSVQADGIWRTTLESAIRSQTDEFGMPSFRLSVETETTYNSEGIPQTTGKASAVTFDLRDPVLKMPRRASFQEGTSIENLAPSYAIEEAVTLSPTEVVHTKTHPAPATGVPGVVEVTRTNRNTGAQRVEIPGAITLSEQIVAGNYVVGERLGNGAVLVNHHYAQNQARVEGITANARIGGRDTQLFESDTHFDAYGRAIESIVVGNGFTFGTSEQNSYNRYGLRSSLRTGSIPGEPTLKEEFICNSLPDGECSSVGGGNRQMFGAFSLSGLLNWLPFGLPQHFSGRAFGTADGAYEVNWNGRDVSWIHHSATRSLWGLSKGPTDVLSQYERDVIKKQVRRRGSQIHVRRYGPQNNSQGGAHHAGN